VRNRNALASRTRCSGSPAMRASSALRYAAISGKSGMPISLHVRPATWQGRRDSARPYARSFRCAAAGVRLKPSYFQFSMSSRMSLRAPSPRAQALEEGRESFRMQAWGAAFSQLSEADREEDLGAEDLLQLAQAALLIGRETEGVDHLARAHQAFLNRGEVQPAARCAFWLGFTLLIAGESAKAGGWLSLGGADARESARLRGKGIP